jgi:hypothetical protein
MVTGEIEVGVRLGIFSGAICELHYEMGLISAFGPCFTEITTDRLGRTPDLRGKPKFLLAGKLLAGLKYSQRKGIGLLIHDQILC